MDDPGQVGHYLGRWLEDPEGLLLQVQFPGSSPRFVPVTDLEAVGEVATRPSAFARSASFRRVLTAVQLEGRLSQLIYSLDATNTEFRPHQYKPVLGLLDSPARGLLVADEVGLGKTIAAGLAWTELRFRAQADSLLVVCRKRLVAKWKRELAEKFGTECRELDAAGLLAHLRGEARVPAGVAMICSLDAISPPKFDVEVVPGPSDTRRRTAAGLAIWMRERIRELSEGPGIDDARRPFDLVVIDEAHELRNPSTGYARLGRLLRPLAGHLLLLSATPINTKSRDLHSLVSILDPDQFPSPEDFGQLLEANRPLVLVSALLSNPDKSTTAGKLAGLLEQAAGHWMLSEGRVLGLLRSQLASIDPDKPLDPEYCMSLRARLERANLLGHVVTRTRKRDIGKSIERRVERRAARMAPSESAVYQLACGAITEYAARHRGVEGFLVAMPQRQLASCMHAAIARWQTAPGNQQREMLELLYESYGFEELKPGKPDAPVVWSVAKALAGVDLARLREDDSKFGVLREILWNELWASDPAEKVIVFSYFVDTLRYLQGRLAGLGVRAMVLTGSDDVDEAIRQFEDSPGGSVLLSSEVAAEGVDLQFARVVVNYDLPWNPMRVEQRIGRVDRIGQKSPYVRVFNVVHEDTVDDRILSRLYERLDLFRDALGCTEDVIGNDIGRLAANLVAGRVAQGDEDAAVEGVLDAIQARRAELEDCDAEGSSLVGLFSATEQRVVDARAAQRRITDEDLALHLREFLEVEAPGHRLRLDAAEGMAGTLELPRLVAEHLARYREQHGLKPSGLERANSVQVLVRNHVLALRPFNRHELLNQCHPLVRMVASSVASRQATETGGVIHAIRVEMPVGGARQHHANGLYAFVVEHWEFPGAQAEVEIGTVFVPLGGGEPLDGYAAFDLLNLARSRARDWVDARSELPDEEMLAEALARARHLVANSFAGQREWREAERGDRLRLRREIAERRFQRREHSLLERILAFSLDRKDAGRQLAKGQLAKARERRATELRYLDDAARRESQRRVLLEGFVRFEQCLS